MLGMCRRCVHCDHIPVELLDLRDGHEVRLRERLDVVHRLFGGHLLGWRNEYLRQLRCRQGRERCQVLVVH